MQCLRCPVSPRPLKHCYNLNQLFRSIVTQSWRRTDGHHVVPHSLLSPPLRVPFLQATAVAAATMTAAATTIVAAIGAVAVRARVPRAAAGRARARARGPAAVAGRQLQAQAREAKRPAFCEAEGLALNCGGVSIDSAQAAPWVCSER